MNIKKHVPKFASVLLSFAMLFGNVLPAYATEAIVTESVLEETEQIEDGGEGLVMLDADAGIQADSEGRYEEIEVNYSQSSSYFVTIPKKITLGADKRAPYSVKVEGDIVANKQVCVVPVDGITDTEVFDFYMEDQIAGSTKEDVVAEVSQAKFYWNHEEAKAGYEEHDNYIVADGLSAGRWKGTFQMEISMRTDPSHIHNYVGEITKEPTCTEAGEKTYTCDCGESYAETIDPTDHHYENGECTDCGEKDPSHEHSYREETTKEPTCTEAGEKKYTCDCGDSYTEEIPAKGHSYGADDKCINCGGLNPNHQHEYMEEITKAPSCTEEGERTLTCNCGDTKKETIPKTEHNFENGVCKNCGLVDTSVVEVAENNAYIAKSRGLSFEITVPDAENISCSMNENDQITLEGNVVSVEDNASIGSIIPITVVGDDKTYKANVIVAPDISNNSYEIYTSTDLKTLAVITNNNAINDVNQNARLMNDIDLYDVCSAAIGNWSAIGFTSPYKGIFDGQGYTIDGLYYVNNFSSNTSSNYYIGLFGRTSTAVIKNTTLNGKIQITSSNSNSKGQFFAGGFTGYSSDTVFENLVNNCTVSAQYSSITLAKTLYAGGISGYGGGNFTNCTNNGNITGQDSTGGISGYRGSFTNCTNTGTIISHVKYAGGISGSDGSSFTYCSNSGSVSGKDCAGGIAGLSSKSSVKFNHCYNTANVSGGTTGGICGNGSSTAYIDSCYNTGRISGSNYAGGIVGLNLNRITNCYNKGYIQSATCSGGIVGNSATTRLTVQNCYNIGNVYGSTATASPGGISGVLTSQNTLINCFITTTTNVYMTGNIVAKSTYGSSSNHAGYITGYNGSNPVVTDCARLTEDNLKSYARTLGPAFKDDTNNINNGYPILAFQEE